MARITLITLSFLIIITSYSQKNSSPSPFLEEIILNYPNVRDIAIFDKEVYFTLQSRNEEFSAIVYTRKESNKWLVPSVVSFSGQYNDLEPFISPDGLILYFASNRPLDSNSTQSKDFDIWFTTRSSVHSNWQNPMNIGNPVNTKYNEFYPSLSLNKNLYYTSDRPDSKGEDDIFLAVYSNSGYKDPVSLSDSINTVGYEFNAFVSPDETFIIFTGYNRKDGNGSGDLYISLKDKNGNWTRSRNLGSIINSDKMDYCPYVDIKTGTMYFTSKKTNVETKFILPQNIDQLLTEFNKYENGASRLYKVNIKDWLK